MFQKRFVEARDAVRAIPKDKLQRLGAGELRALATRRGFATATGWAAFSRAVRQHLGVAEVRVGRNAPTLYAWGEALADSYGRLHDTICVTDANGSALLIRRVCACEESLQVLALDAAMNLIFASLSLRMEGHAAVAVCVDAGWYEAAGIDGTRRAVLEPINRDALERRLGLKVLPVRAFANVARAALVAARARDDGGQPELVDVPLAAIKRTIAPVARVHHAPRGAKATPAVTFKRHHAIQAAAAC